MAALRREDFAAACLAWERFRSLEPDNPEGFIRGLAALRALARHSEAAGLADLSAARFPDNTDVTAERARLAEMQSQWGAAADLWRGLLERAPDSAAAILGLAKALTASGRQAEADEVLARSCEAYPQNIEILIAHAEYVARKRDWALAERLWADVRALQPNHLHGLLGLSEALIQQKRYEEAEAAITAFHLAVRPHRFSSETFARIAGLREDWDESERRWLAVIDQFPESWMAWSGVASARLKRGNIKEAEDAAAEGARRFPNSRVVLELYASLAESARDWREADRRWEQLRKAVPGYAEAWLNQARSLRYLGDFPKATAVLREAETRFPDHAGIASFRTDLAVAAGQWDEAARFMRAKLAAFPQDRGLRKHLFHANWRGLGSVDEAVAQQALAPAPIPPHDDHYALLMQFESLGSDSEFATVQRFYGAEPISLFRWGEFPTESLITALRGGLEGVGEPESTAMALGGDYKTQDRRYGLMSHTFVKEESVDRSIFFESECRRLKYLRQSFMDEIENGEKIFVYKTFDRDPIADVKSLHAGLRRHGDAVLLYVCRADAAHPDGHLEQTAPGLFMGYLKNIHDSQGAADIDCAAWIKLCRATIAAVDNITLEEAAKLPLRDLALRFESMGNTCEFGHVQRYCAAEPLGLLRWTTTEIRSLAKALHEGLQGVGDPGQTELVNNFDYKAVDKRYGFTPRTFLRADQGDRDAFLAEHCRRTSRLRDRFIEDLRGQPKIFVHKSKDREPVEKIAELYDALRSYGPATLLDVRPEEPGHPNGSLVEHAPGFFVGYIDRLVRHEGGWGMAYTSWLSLCQKLLHLHAPPEAEKSEAYQVVGAD